MSKEEILCIAKRKAMQTIRMVESGLINSIRQEKIKKIMKDFNGDEKRIALEISKIEMADKQNLKAYQKAKSFMEAFETIAA